MLFRFSSLVSVIGLVAGDAVPMPVATESQASEIPVSTKPGSPGAAAPKLPDYDDLSFLDHLDGNAGLAGDDDLLGHDWDEHMMDFQADLMVTVQVAPNGQEFFFEDVKEVGTKLRGAFFVAPDKDKKSGVDFWILNPKGEKVYQQANKGEAIFSHKADQVGTYSFVFSNNKWVASRQVTFIVGSGSRATLKQEHLVTMEDRVKAIDSSLREIQTEGSYLWIRQKSQLQAIEDVNSRVFWFTVLEFLVLVTVAIVQVYSIKNMLSYRRLF